MTWTPMADGFAYSGATMRFRAVSAKDANRVTIWRNQASARRGFFSGETVTTPDTHLAFLTRREPHDLVWIVELEPPPPHDEFTRWDEWTAIGMLSLTIDPDTRRGESGRHLLDEAYQGRGLWSEAEWLLLSLAFDVFRLDSLFVRVFADNAPMIASQERMGWSGRSVVSSSAGGREIVELTYDRARWDERRMGLWAYVTDKRAGVCGFNAVG